MASMGNPRYRWDQNFTDFDVVTKSGSRLKIHKHVLAKNSQVFLAMLTQGLEEAKNNEVNMSHFDEETVVAFIEYLYAGSVNDSKTLNEIRAGIGPNEYIYKRSFERKHLTIDLLKMADMYQVEDLKMDCTEYLKEHISDENVMSIWMEAHTLDNKTLAWSAINHLVGRPNERTLQEVPGFTEAFQARQNDPLKNLVDVLSDKNMCLRGENLKLREEMADLRQRVKELELTRRIKIRLICHEWTGVFSVWTTDKLSKLIRKAKDREKRDRGNRSPLFSGNQTWGCLMKDTRDIAANNCLDEETTFLNNGISSDTTLYIMFLVADAPPLSDSEN